MLLVYYSAHLVVGKVVFEASVTLPVFGFASGKNAFVHLMPLIYFLQSIPGNNLFSGFLRAGIQSRIIFGS